MTVTADRIASALDHNRGLGLDWKEVERVVAGLAAADSARGGDPLERAWIRVADALERLEYVRATARRWRAYQWEDARWRWDLLKEEAGLVA